MNIKSINFEKMIDVQQAFAVEILEKLPQPKWKPELDEFNLGYTRFLTKYSVRKLLSAQLLVSLSMIKNFEKNNAGVLIGAPGVGKTTMSNSIALSMLYNQKTNDFHEKGKNILFEANGAKHLDKMKREIQAYAGDMVTVYEISAKAIAYTKFMNLPEKKRKSLKQGKLNLIRIEDVSLVPKLKGHLNYFILSKDEDKRSYKRELIKEDCCPNCNIPIKSSMLQFKRFNENEKESFFNIKRSVLKEIEEAKNKKRRFTIEEEIVKCKNCDEKLYNGIGKSINIAEKIKRTAGKVTNKLFDLAIIDEAHEMQDPDSWQTKTYRAIVKTSKKVLIMTGTLSNGRASSVFHILYPIVANQFKKYGGFDYNKIDMFIDFFGARKSILRVKKNTTDIIESKPYEIAKINDRIVSFLMPYSAWISMGDLNIDMPEFKEEVVIVNLDHETKQALNSWKSKLGFLNIVRNGDQEKERLSLVGPRAKIFEEAIVYRINNLNKEYEHKVIMEYIMDKTIEPEYLPEYINDKFMSILFEKIQRSKNRLNVIEDIEYEDEFIKSISSLSNLEIINYIQNNFMLSDFVLKEKIVKDAQSIITCSFNVLVKSDISDESLLSSKELKLIEILKKEKIEGRRVLLYTDYNGANNIQERLLTVLLKNEVSVNILDSTVKARNIEKWLVDSTEDVIIVNQVRVATGLDLVMFHSTLFYEISDRIRVVQQAKFRPWRPIGQTKNVKAIYLGYIEYQKPKLIDAAHKMRAAAAIEGDLLDQDSIAYMFDYSPEITAAIAKISNQIEDDSFVSEIKKEKESEIQVFYKSLLKVSKYAKMPRIVLKNVKKFILNKNKTIIKNKRRVTTYSMLGLLNNINNVSNKVKLDIVELAKVSISIIEDKLLNNSRVVLRNNKYKLNKTTNNINYNINSNGQMLFVF